MSSMTIGIIGIILLLILLFSKMPVGYVMAVVGFIGFAYIRGYDSAMHLLAGDFYETFSSYNMTVVPLFVLMGQLAFQGGISRRLYDSAYKILGKYHGGLAIATIGACAAFSAISGSTSATAATMATVAIPEMKRYNYNMSLATGVLSASGSLGILLPPSVIFIMYGILTEQSIGKLFAAGILPGIFLAGLFMATVLLIVRIDPSLGPSGPNFSFKEKIRAILSLGETLILFITIMGGIFFGIFTPTEAAAAGALITAIIAIGRGELSWKSFWKAMMDSLAISCMVLIIVSGAFVFGHFMAITQLPYKLATWVANLPFPNYIVMIIIIFIYLAGGCFMDSFAMIVLTIPIFFPVSQTLGFDPIWFGVVIVLVTEMGVITPPVGINVFVVSGIAKDVPLMVIFKGAFPFLIALVVCSLILLLVPPIATFLPSLM